jgi:hypothetical protein
MRGWFAPRQSSCTRPFRERALFGNVALNVHSVVEDAYDFDRAFWSDSVHQEEAATTTVPRNMQRTKTRHDLVPGPGSHDIGTAGQFANRLNECVPIDTRLSGAKIFRRPFENIRKIEFRSGTETDTPSPLGHKGFYSAVLEMTFSERSFK